MTTPIAPPLGLSSIGYSTVLQHISGGGPGYPDEQQDTSGVDSGSYGAGLPPSAPGVAGSTPSFALPFAADASAAPPPPLLPFSSYAAASPERAAQTSAPPAPDAAAGTYQPSMGAQATAPPASAAPPAAGAFDAATQAIEMEASGTQTDACPPPPPERGAAAGSGRSPVKQARPQPRRPQPGDSSEEDADSEPEDALPPKYKAGAWRCVCVGLRPCPRSCTCGPGGSPLCSTQGG